MNPTRPSGRISCLYDKDVSEVNVQVGDKVKEKWHFCYFVDILSSLPEMIIQRVRRLTEWCYEIK